MHVQKMKILMLSNNPKTFSTIETIIIQYTVKNMEMNTSLEANDTQVTLCQQMFVLMSESGSLFCKFFKYLNNNMKNLTVQLKHITICLYRMMVTIEC